MTQNNDKMREHLKRSGLGTKRSLFCRRSALRKRACTAYAILSLRSLQTTSSHQKKQANACFFCLWEGGWISCLRQVRCALEPPFGADNKQSRKSACIFSACAEDSKPKFARQGKNFKAAAIVKPKQKLKANFWVRFFCKLQILKDVQSKSSPRSYSA